MLGESRNKGHHVIIMSVVWSNVGAPERQSNGEPFFQTQYRHESLAIVSTESQLVYSEFMQSLVLIAFNFKLENVLQV
jgi:hypothetical protein